MSTTEAITKPKIIHARGFREVPKDLEGERYRELKRKVIKPENYEAVKESWIRLCKAMEQKAIEIKKAGSSYIPEIEYSSDFTFEYNYGPNESNFEDRGKITNVLSEDGKRALGLVKFDTEEAGLTPGQIKIRKMANLAVFKSE